MTHIEIDQDLLPSLGKSESVLTDNCGSVEAFDFAKANSSYEARVQAVTKVASVCYGNPKSLGSINLFNRLEAESHGLPSSSYEFVPVLLTEVQYLNISSDDTSNVEKYGEWICPDMHGNKMFLLTNLRALIADVGPEESLNYLNTDPAEQQIIRDNFKVFLFNVDLATRAQMVRHRVSWQELSRRYVSGKKRPFEFYISEKLDNLSCSTSSDLNPFGKSIVTQQLIDLCINHYDAAIEAGVKPEEARRILPQAMMTTIWGAFLPNQLDNFFQLRLDKHAQHEIRQVAKAMKGLL